MNVDTFRGRLLKAIKQIQSRQPKALAHLLYAPELSDPLGLVNDTRRDTAFIVTRALGVPMTWPKEAWPRVVTLDCTRVAPYLLETDPGLDDPLLESSIAQAHAELYLGAGMQGTVAKEGPGFAEGAVCGWVVSTETASQVAARLVRHAAPPRQQEEQTGAALRMNRSWVHWYQPERFAALWPTLDAQQREALLGPGSWLLHTVTGELQHFCAEQTTAESSTGTTSGRPIQLKVIQWQALDNAPIVKQISKQWQELWTSQGRAWPADAPEQLQRHVQAARQLRLDDENLALYAMAAVHLIPGGTQAPEFVAMVSAVVNRDGSLREGLRSLSEPFWERYLLPPTQAHNAAVTPDPSAIKETTT